MNLSSISSADISVVVQGPVDSKTAKCLKRLRQYLPRAEIILSTWKNYSAEVLDYDVLLLNKDIGAFNKNLSSPKLNNLNRQLITTQKGLLKATRKYALKIRSDCILGSDKFLDFFNSFPKRTEKYNFFSSRVIVPSVYTNRFYYSREKGIFHTPLLISDFWMFGLLDDVKKYYLSASLVKEPDYSLYWSNKPANRSFLIDNLWRFPPEQYIGVSAFSTHFPELKMENMEDISPIKIQAYDEILANNFIVLDYNQHNILWCGRSDHQMQKGKNLADFIEAGIVHYHTFLTLYKRYCDADFLIPFNARIHNILFDLKENISVLKIKLSKFCTPIFSFIGWISLPFQMIYLSALFISKFTFKLLKIHKD